MCLPIVLLSIANVYSSNAGHTETKENRQYVSSVFEGLGYTPVCVASSLASCERFSKPDCYLHVLYLLPELKALLQETKCSKKEEAKQHFAMESPINSSVSLEEINLHLQKLESIINEKNKVKSDNYDGNLINCVYEFQKIKNQLQSSEIRLSGIENSIAKKSDLHEMELALLERHNKTVSAFNLALEELKLFMVDLTSGKSSENNETIKESQDNLTLCHAEILRLNSLIQDTTNKSASIDNAIYKIPSEKSFVKPKNCGERFLFLNETTNGVQKVYPYYDKDRTVEVICDHTVDGKGWTVFQNRDVVPIGEDFYGQPRRRSFERNWTEYVAGFGNLNGEFWLGLDNLHALTNSTQMELRVDLEDYDGAKRFAKYGTFRVGDASTKYLLSIAKYSGNAGDSLLAHNGMMFSTYEKDNDQNSGNCAKVYKGAWWYKSCHQSNLNGYQHVGEPTPPNNEGIIWHAFRSHTYSLKKASMKIRLII